MDAFQDNAVAAKPRIPGNRYLIFGGITTVGAGVDLATKSWIFGKLWPSHDVIWLWTGHFGLETTVNEGAVFGVGQGMVAWFVGLSLLAALGILYWLFIHREARDLWLTIALGGIMAGILGNLFDRLGWHGLIWPAGYPGHKEGEPVHAVRDWILVQWNDELRWPNFNIADSFLVCCAILLLAHAFLVRPDPKEDRPARVRRPE